MPTTEDNRHQAAGDGRVRLFVDRFVGLAKQRTTLGVADDDVRGAGAADHRRADLAGERAFTFPMHVLGCNGDRGALGRFGGSRQ